MKLLLLLISTLCELIFHFTLVNTSELRFCYHGWQRLKKSECPYGIIFKTPLDLECYYSVGDDTPNLYDNICTEPYTLKQPDTPTSGYPLVQNLAKILMVDYMNNSVSPKPARDYTDLTTCYKECMESEEEDFQRKGSHEIDSEENMEEEDALTSISEETKKRITDQTLRLGDYLFDKLYTMNLGDLRDQNETDQPQADPEIRLLEMFRKTMLVMAKTCKHPFLHQDYINRVYHGFMFLVRDMGTHTIEDVSVEEYEDILEALNLCEQKGQTFRLEGSICPSKATVSEIVMINSEGTELSASVSLTHPENQFALDKYDLFIESAWRAIDAVHGMCFTNFRPNSNMHHRYQRAMEMLFNEKMQERWINPTELEDIQDWGTWFMVDIQATMDNLQHCVRGAYEGAPFPVRLDRPVDHKRFKRDLWNRVIPSNERRKKHRRRRSSDPLEITNPFQDPFEEHWRMYDTDGGIIMKLGKEVQCMRTESERLRTLSNLRLACGAVAEPDEDSASEPPAGPSADIGDYQYDNPNLKKEDDEENA